MSKTKRREQAARRQREYAQHGARRVFPCPNGCGDPGPHYVPPSFGDPGFYLCTPTAQEATHA